MPVLNVARGQVNESADQRSTSTSGANGQSSSDTESERIDIAGRLSNSVEEFITGLIPGRTSVDINWSALSPILSVIGDAMGVVAFLVGWL